MSTVSALEAHRRHLRTLSAVSDVIGSGLWELGGEVTDRMRRRKISGREPEKKSQEWLRQAIEGPDLRCDSAAGTLAAVCWASTPPSSVLWVFLLY